MKRLIFLFLISSFIAYADESVRRLVILELKPIHIEKYIAESATERLTTQLSKSGKFKIIEKAQIDKVFTQLKLMTNDDYDDSTLIQIGKMAKAKNILVGSINQIGQTITINIRIVDIETGEIVYGNSIDTDSTGNINRTIDQLVILITDGSNTINKKRRKIIIHE